MDVDESSFYHILPTILDDIGRAIFVAVDLEMSGVPIKQTRVAGQATGKQTLQQRYEEIKAAAEKYQILQVGLTFVHYDSESSTYVCKPYNIPISPLVQDTSLDIERSITFSSSAATFLRSVLFDFSKPFNDGVFYLSQDEARLAYEKFDARQKRGFKTTLDIKQTDVEALAFLEKTRKDIKFWLSSDKRKKDDFLNVGPPAFDVPGVKPGLQPEMTKYEKWLVHQLVQVEFPELRTAGRRGFIQISRYDQTHEARILAERRAEFDVRAARQKGFTWVVDALLGNELSVEQLSHCLHEVSANHDTNQGLHRIRQQIQEACDRLLRRPSVIVGHNCFLDLVYIYHSFIGTLPESVQDFASALQDKLPLVIDTKYMATHNCGDIPPHSSLEELARRLQPENCEQLSDSIDPTHDKYAGTDFDFYHEAGFDSLLTAQVAIRLSRQLEAAGHYLDDVNDGGVSLTQPGGTPTSYVSKVVDKSVQAVSATLSSLGLASEKSPPEMDSKFGASGPTSTDSDKRSTKQLQTAGSEAQVESSPREGGVPGFDSDFWRVYGNHLRVFGTQEGVLAFDTTVS